MSPSFSSSPEFWNQARDKTLALLVLVIVGCTSGVTDVLATRAEIPGAVSLGSSSGIGELVLDEECLLFQLTTGKAILPIWPDSTSWDPDSEHLVFDRLDAEPITIRLGEPIQLGGATMVTSDPPGLSIPADCENYEEAFVVSEVKVEG